ncbi:hypothetical protein GP2143_03064 [marine gamma proteobacterium HTCC2143]|jgi:hypothetical protein|uniref:Uncharacterized protein n=1 Tax=marine gamma proteobacterium HTCC2143 TaxID=247633 RepID=A0YEN4_9GAMM|nr:hypothetical protein GP2143_03064 [marine gamma proteobacterium HTCC2143]
MGCVYSAKNRGNTMNSFQDDLSVIAEELKSQRDVLALKMHLAAAEVKDEWTELEKKWENFDARSEQVKETLDETVGEVGDDLKELSNDLKDGYKRIRQLLK